MLSLQECLDLSGLTEEEIQVIAEHEHVPDIVAAEMGNALLNSPKGLYAMRRFIQENLENAISQGQRDKAKRLERLYDRFVSAHPMPRVL